MAIKTMGKCEGLVPVRRMDFVKPYLFLACLVVLISFVSAIHITDENGKNITNPYHESAKIQFSQKSVLSNDNNVQIEDNKIKNNSYLGQLLEIYTNVKNHIKKRSESCGMLDVMCLIRQSKDSTRFLAEPFQMAKATEFIDIDNNLDKGDEPLSRNVREVKGRKKNPMSSTHDDEDYMAPEDASGEIEGSGEIHDFYKPKHDGSIHTYTTTTEASAPSPGQPHYYRIMLKVNEPYREEYQDRSSPEYQSFQQSIVQAIEELYQSVEGRQSVNLVNIQKNSDQFFFKVTLDIGTLDFYDQEVIEDVLKRHIRDTHRLGPYMVTSDEFSFRDFGESPSRYDRNCEPHQLPCRSGECLDASKRCDGVSDCSDGSDELGCAEIPAKGHEHDLDAHKTSPAPDEVPDRCRADDKVRCTDGTAYICRDQVCDGISDCNNGWDESNCTSTTTECSDGEFMCDVTRCIPLSKKCDGYPDCTDQLDERDCEAQCTPDQFRCRSGKCIEHFRRCDHIPDCPDNEDEFDCTCSPEEFTCADGTCIDLRRKCDGHGDCFDFSDETGCQPTTPPSSECRPDEFSCHYGGCVDFRVRCDGQRDCPNDESDEWDCPPPNTEEPSTCRPDEFTCDYGGCIDHRFRCDGKRDCPNDDSDERNCVEISCASDEFKCHDDSRCIPTSRVCDRVPDCSDGSDEQNCDAPPSCSSNQFRCNDGTCLNIDQRCNGVNECRDGEDERGCSAPSTCGPHQFQCNNGMCIDLSEKCDGVPHCSDRSDEESCGFCAEGDFRCEDGSCVASSKRCDGRHDCRDGSDEIHCGAHGCSENEFTCGDGSCIPNSAKCNGVRDCSDGSDESNCYPPDLRPCSHNEFTCQDGQCIDIARKCDGAYDCRDGSDERKCRCEPHEFTCRSGDCIPNSGYCDGRRDCLDGSDEENCYSAFCNIGQFACHSGDQCVPQSAHCDGQYQCRDYSDELNCGPTPRGELKLVTYPSSQIIKEGREVVFQCRDEGPLRARVKWVRDGLPLPPGSVDINGRLEIPNIHRSQGGTYFCEAPDYLPSVSGQRVSVILKVESYEPSTRQPACRSHEATCSNGECINKSQVCDGRNDCTDGSDELRCSLQGCEPNEFRCNNRKCVSKAWRCDFDDDCGDGSDEENCHIISPGGVCQPKEFTCRTGTQCIPKSYECDGEFDCQDGSDESQCSKPKVIIPPPPEIRLPCNAGRTLVINCTAIGGPVPEISWRRNWGHVPNKCTQTSKDGFGVLTCPDIQEGDQGAYSCEALNTRGADLGIPDAQVMCSESAPSRVCPLGTFNSAATRREECLNCFGFGKALSCTSADFFIYDIPAPLTPYKLIGVKTTPDGGAEVRPNIPFRSLVPNIRPVTNGFQLFTRATPDDSEFGENVIPYFVMPDDYRGNQLKSYGSHLKYTLTFNGNGRPIIAPDVIITGRNGEVLLYSPPSPHYPGVPKDVSIRFWPGYWKKPTPRGLVSAGREDIMVVLVDIDSILIRAQYIDGDVLDTTVANVRLESAGPRDSGLGKSVFVEHAQCPAGYIGLSCEDCPPGYERRPGTDRWRGECVREIVSCPAGTYGDPARNIPCQVCPCPLTNPSNQFGRTCHLDGDGQVTCDCPPGYMGRRCERCDVGFAGNPNIPGDSCKSDICDPNGSISPLPNPSTGLCMCKDFATGPTCNQCKANTFHLSAANIHGCISCFCSGVTEQCDSSRWYRNQVTSSFARDTQGFKLQEYSTGAFLDSGIHFDATERELVYQDFNRRSPEVYYWVLPPSFLGNKVTSYGGYLTYTVRYSTVEGGGISKNNAPDVELISDNDIRLLYFHTKEVEVNEPQTVSVQLLEQFWQRHDGKPANREHLIMALADLKSILIKATYTTFTKQASLIKVSLDIAEERNTGQQRAVEVEHCQCPVGYRGLSCEDCDIGFTRTEEGLYLGTCEPCSCNGHSSECDPETGVCTNCRHGTTGENCDECQPGYSGDPLSSEGCYPSGESLTCNCDPRGSFRTDCPGGQCICKTNVEGRNCDQCRYGSFSLSQDNVEGCHKCFCSGVTENCQASNLYVTQIPMQILDDIDNHFTLSDISRRSAIKSGFSLNSAENEIGYRFPPGRTQHLFWTLPPGFTGNKVASYGGQLTLSQRFETTYASRPSPDKDVIMIGNGITVFWDNPQEVPSNSTQVISVPIKERDWQRLENSGPRPASRSDLMSVLSNIEAILVLATPYTQLEGTYLSDIALDTAVSHYSGDDNRATDVEICRCPPGYEGLSCEACQPGYYRDIYDRSSPSAFGVCKKCPCNDHEESCLLEADGRVLCSCKQGYTGRYCEMAGSPERPPEPQPPRPYPPYPSLNVSINEPVIQVIQVGETARFKCNGQSTDPGRQVNIRWYKEDGDLPAGRHIEDRDGLLVIHSAEVSDSGTYICDASDGYTTETRRATLVVGGSAHRRPQITIEPRVTEVREGEPVEIRCTATGTPAPFLRWNAGHGGSFSPDVTFYDGVLYIPRVKLSDGGNYICTAVNEAGQDSQEAMLIVRSRESGPSEHVVRVNINPSEYNGPGRETVTFYCQAPSGYNVKWSRSQKELPPQSVVQDGVLTIYDVSASDSGLYICTAFDYVGRQAGESAARINVYSAGAPPTVQIEPERLSVAQGSVAELRCDARGDPPPKIRWTRIGQDLGDNARDYGSMLRIENIMMKDRGTYLCIADSPSGSAQASAFVDVERSETPAIELYPSASQTVQEGGSLILQCRITRGDPPPQIRWSKSDGRSFGSNIEELPNGVLRFSDMKLEDAGQFICRAENSAGSVDAVANIEVHSRPVISIIPSNDITVTEGQRVKIECRATGSPIPSVSWSKTGYGARPFTGAGEGQPMSAILEITRVTKADEGSYSCVAINSAGTTEERVMLRVELDNNIGPTRGDIPGGGEDFYRRPRPPYQPDDRRNYNYPEYQRPPNYPEDPRYPQSPDDSSRARPPYPNYPSDYAYSVPVGGRAEIRCQAQRLAPGEYLDWIRAGNVSLPPGSRVDNGSLYIENVQPEYAGEYQCIGINSYGQLLFTAKANLVVVAPPRITLQPIRQVVRPGDSAYTTCSAVGDEPINIEWSAVNRRLPSSAYVNGGILNFRSISVHDAGKYLCRATNLAGEAEAIAEVVVLGPETSSSIMAAETDITARVGSSASLSCYVHPDSSGRQPPVYWSREGGYPLQQNAIPRGEVLQIVNISPSDEGRYVCQISTPSGTSSDYVYLRVDRSGERCQDSREFECIESRECIPIHSVCDGVVDCRDQSDERYCRRGRDTPKVFLRIEPSSSNVKEGDVVELRCYASGDDPSPTLTWSKLDSSFSNNIQTIDNVLRITDAREENNGVYRCRAKSGTNVHHEDYVLTVQAANEMSGGELKTSPYGQTVDLDCKTDLEPPVSYSWRKQTGSLPGDSYIRERSLVINEVRAQDAGTYICTAQNAVSQVDIPVTLVVTGVVPQFSQSPNSYMVFPTLPDAYLNFDIEVSFKPERENGLILYNGQQKGGSGDFVSLGLNQGFVEFKFDVGSGTAVIKNNKPISVGEWHTVKITRSRKDGIMYVDGEGPFTGTATGTFQGLDLMEPLFIGGLPSFDNVHRSLGHTSGLVGCISRLKIGSTEHDLVKDATHSEGITSCQTCSESQCRNKGICQEAPTKEGYICLCPPGYNGQKCDKIGENCYHGACGEGKCSQRDDGVHCKCPLGKEGRRCERDLEIIEPYFKNDAYIAYPTPKALRKLKVSMKIKPDELKDGIFMYCGNDEDGLRDYVSLAMKDGGIVFSYNNDSGPTNLRVDNFFREKEWLTVNALRDVRESRLSVKAGDDEREVTDTISRNPMLHLKTPLYIGGYDSDKIRVSHNIGVSSGFSGCISNVEISGVDIDMKSSAIDSANVGNCPGSSARRGSLNGRNGNGNHHRVSPCAAHPCLNGGMCYPEGHSYSCVCPEGYSGRHCETQTGLCYTLNPCKNNGICTGTETTYSCQCAFGFAGPTCEERLQVSASVSFQGNGYVELRQDLVGEKSQEANNIVIEFSTSEDGLLYWHGQEAHQNGRGQDYLAVAVVDGYLEMNYELGSGPVRLRSDMRVDDGRRHRVVLTRTAKEGRLEVDNDGNIKFGESGGHLTSLNAAGNIYIGGVPDFDRMTSGLYSRGLNGCIHSLTIGGSSVNFNNSVLSSRNVQECARLPYDEEDENYDEFVN